ncbi:hypothetical protein [Streptomyces pseudovenezuelae]
MGIRITAPPWMAATIVAAVRSAPRDAPIEKLGVRYEATVLIAAINEWL